MATTTKDDHGHGHDDGAVHAHVSSVPFYLLIFGALIFFTVLTVGQSYVDLGKLNLLFVILIASCKASLVVLFFMHLRHDNKLHGVLFVCGLLFIGVFFAYTFNDTEHRAEMEETSSVPVLPRTGEQAPGSMDEKAILEARAKMVKEHHAGGGDHGATPEKGPEKAPEHH